MEPKSIIIKRVTKIDKNKFKLEIRKKLLILTTIHTVVIIHNKLYYHSVETNRENSVWVAVIAYFCSFLKLKERNIYLEV